MAEKSKAILQGLLRTHHKGQIEPFQKFFPDDVWGDVVEAVVDSDVFSAFSLSLSKSLDQVHYSWLYEAAQKVPPDSFDLYFSALPAEQANAVCRLMQRSLNRISLSHLGKRYLVYQFKQSFFQEEETLPPALLPQSESNVLLTFSKKSLVQLIDYLGIRDLATKLLELKSESLQNHVKEALTADMGEFLEICLEEGELVQVSPFDLEQWDGDRGKLAFMLQKSGMVRLAKGLCGQHPALVKHLCQRLDTGRGHILHEHYSEQELPEVTPLVNSQILSAVDFLNRLSEKGD